MRGQSLGAAEADRELDHFHPVEDGKRLCLAALTSDTYRRHLGPEGDPLTLVAQGSSRTLNPSLPQRVVDRALEKDGARAAAEYMAQFRTDVEGFVSLEVVEACVGDYREQLPVPCNDPATGATHSAHECYQAIGRGAILVC